MARRGRRRALATGLAFLLPNILGFLVFTLFPLGFSLVMAFTNWDVRLHNVFTGNTVRFVGLENFARLFREPDFFQYLGNTLFLMMGIPVAVAGSLGAALLLSRDFRPRSTPVLGILLGAGGLLLGTALMTLAGAGAMSMTILLVGLAGVILLGGTIGRHTFYRTLYYFPHFTAGVATFLLWKKLYNPHTGPINQALDFPLDALARVTNGQPRWLSTGLSWVLVAGTGAALLWGFRRLTKAWTEGEAGKASILAGALILVVPVRLAFLWHEGTAAWVVAAACAAGMLWLTVRLAGGRDWHSRADEGLGQAFVVGGVVLVASAALLGVSRVVADLPAMAAHGLNPPEWLTRYHWAKPSLMIMGFWAAVGSNNMLLYLAGLSNVPRELYEAADVDGATGPQRFWHVTWPQLAPVTFFILVMAVIHGLQGGFEMARSMTKGGPAGATTTLSYYIYIEGFETGRLGFASAVAWMLFLLVFIVTLVNWKFGNRYVND